MVLIVHSINTHSFGHGTVFFNCQEISSKKKSIFQEKVSFKK